MEGENTLHLDLYISQKKLSYNIGKKLILTRKISSIQYAYEHKFKRADFGLIVVAIVC